MTRPFRSIAGYRRAFVAALLATTVFAGSAGYFTARALPGDQIAAAPPITPEMPAARPGFADLVTKVKPAVVNISTTEKPERSARPNVPDFPPGSPFEQFFRQFEQQMERQNRQPRHALGSGFIIDPAGWIVTNNHVVAGASKIMVTLEDGSEHTASLKGRDEKTDLALLKIEVKKDLPYVAFGDSDSARIGDWVVAVGNPFGLGGSVTAGILSARGRDLNNGPYDNFMQIDAPINPGNSGGPLFDHSGRVIGISTAIYTPNGGNVGIGFAVPSNLASQVIAQIREHGEVKRGWLGVSMQPMTETLAKALGREDSNGVIVNEVQPDSPAEKAGLKQGDVVVAINGKAIAQPRDLALAVAGIAAGQKADLQVWRDGKSRTVTVAIGTMPKEQTASAASAEDEGRVGLALAPLTPETRGRFGLDSKTQGVVVADVSPDSKAAESGMRPGDVIVSIAGDTIATPDQAVAKIRAAQEAKREAIPLLVMRQGTTYYMALQVA